MNKVLKWFKKRGWNAQKFQKECWKAYSEGKNGILHAPTGSGKTYAIWGGIIEESLKMKKQEQLKSKQIHLNKEAMKAILKKT